MNVSLAVSSLALQNNEVKSNTAPKTCRDIYSRENRVVVTLSSGLDVMCDTKTDGGGWIIFQRRINGKVDFYRSWNEYRDGFGNYTIGEFYLGNENIFMLTSRRKYELRIDLEFNRKKYFVQYSEFKLLGESDNYQLKVDGHSGNMGDDLKSHNNKYFTTFDKDNDKAIISNCAVNYTGAWWYEACHDSNLNGKWGSTERGKGVIWYTTTGNTASATFTEMKIRETE